MASAVLRVSMFLSLTFLCGMRMSAAYICIYREHCLLFFRQTVAMHVAIAALPALAVHEQQSVTVTVVDVNLNSKLSQ